MHAIQRLLENVIVGGSPMESALVGVEYRARTAKPVTGIILLKKAKKNFQFKFVARARDDAALVDDSRAIYCSSSTGRVLNEDCGVLCCCVYHHC